MLDMNFSDEQLARIIDQALVYQCACPAQVCKALIGMRELHNYQMDCLESGDTDRKVHERIAADASVAHAQLESCLAAVLEIEGWDPSTLTMPSDLRKTPAREI